MPIRNEKETALIVKLCKCGKRTLYGIDKCEDCFDWNRWEAVVKKFGVDMHGVTPEIPHRK